jgi:RNA polymerase sigma factor (sigma-70 family)
VESRILLPDGIRKMARAESSPIFQLIRRVACDQRAQHLSDHDLLRRFVGQRDEAAFHALLLRHGPMVLEVCRGVLANEADAEDAFQATFLILASRAGAVRKGASVGSWLHGVAYRTALTARAQRATRPKHEAGATTRPVPEPDDPTWRDVRRVLHEEVAGLAERYRGPLVACYLEGRTQDEAAAHLGLGKTTLKERLEHARSLLRAQLVRRGLGPAAVLVAAAWPSASASACLPATLVSSTTKAAGAFAAEQAVSRGVIPVQVAALTEGVMSTMLPTKLKLAMAMWLVVGVLTGVGALAHSQGSGGPGAFVAAQGRTDKEARDALELPQPEADGGPADRAKFRAGAPVPQPEVEDGDPDAKWPTDPPRILEEDPYLLVPRYDGDVLSFGCVAKELKLTDKQVGDLWKLDRELSELTADMAHGERTREYTRALHKHLPQLLTPPQVKRFKQVGLQLLGIEGYRFVGALGYPEIQQALKLSGQQKDDIRALEKEARKEFNEAVEANGGIDVPKGLVLSTRIDKATLEKALLLLDNDQKKSWEGMVGTPFTYTRHDRPDPTDRITRRPDHPPFRRTTHTELC